MGAGYLVQEALRSASRLEQKGISAGVIDLRTLVPLDREGLIREAASAPRLLVIDDDYTYYGMCAEVIATIAEGLRSDAPVMSRHSVAVPIPASAPLEAEIVPSARSIEKMVEDILAKA